MLIIVFCIKVKAFSQKLKEKLENKYAPALDNYGQSCFVRCDFFKNEVRL
jgi:hypothetical protein